MPHINPAPEHPAEDDPHDLIPDWLAKRVPRLYEQEHNDNPTVHVKLFDPSSRWTWYITEYSPVAPDGTPRLAFGWVDGHDFEAGYISIDELAATPTAGGLHIERDIFFQPCPLSRIRPKAWTDQDDA